MKTVLSVTGMTCNHCEKRVEDALKGLGVKASANAKKSVVQFECADEKIEEIKKTITDLGYKVNG